MKNFTKEFKNLILSHRSGLGLGLITGTMLGLFGMAIISSENYNNAIPDFSLQVLIDFGGAFLIGMLSQVFICVVLIDEDYVPID